MTQTYKINLRHHYYSIKEGLILFALTPVGLAVAQLAGKITWDDYPDIIVFFLLYNLVFFLPAFYLHFTYYFDNRKTALTVDSNSKRFSVTNKDNTLDFTFDDIHLAEQHLGIYYKNKIDHRGRWTAPWTGYGYLKLKLKDGQTFFISSLMIDVQNPPLPFTQTKYRFLPFIDRQEVTVVDMQNWIEKERQEKYVNYLEKFAGLPREILQDKVDNKKKYEPEAIAASKKLLELNSNDTTPNEKYNDS